MKFIKRKKDEINLVWGNKYRLKGNVGNLGKSEIVLLISDGVDSDGEVEIATKDNSTWVEPQYLQEIDQTTLEDIAKEEATFLIEINYEELGILEHSLSSFINLGYNKHEADNKPNTLFKEVRELLVMVSN